MMMKWKRSSRPCMRRGNWKLRKITFQKARECATCIPRPNVARVLRGNTPPESGKKASFFPPETLPKGPPIAHEESLLQIIRRLQFAAGLFDRDLPDRHRAD